MTRNKNITKILYVSVKILLGEMYENRCTGQKSNMAVNHKMKGYTSKKC